MDDSTHNANAVALRWAPVGAWVLLVVAAAPAIGAALEDRSRSVQVVGTVGAWAWWSAGILALFLPTSASLTTVRMSAPAGCLATLVAGLAGGPSAIELGLAVAATTATAVLSFNGELGRRFVQGSAYGDETRFPLRLPGALLLPIPLLWLVAAGAVLAGPLLLAAGAWLLGAVVSAFGAAWTTLLGLRLHRLSRRWLVFVPAGVVVHDQTVLAETSMFARSDVAGCELAAADTEAADLTGTALGTAVEFRLRTGGDKVVLAATKDAPRGRGIHVRSFIVSPSLPGAALREARRRGYPGFS